MYKGFVNCNFFGNLEWWSDGILGFSKGTIIPLFQYSIIPVSFWQNVGAWIILTYQAKFIFDTTDKKY